MAIDWLLVGQGILMLWYAFTTLAVWRFCDAMDGNYFWLRVEVTLFWPVVLPVCGVVFLLGGLKGPRSRLRQRSTWIWVNAGGHFRVGDIVAVHGAGAVVHAQVSAAESTSMQVIFKDKETK